MADSASGKYSDDDINKEEGEITDDDENEESRVEIPASRREEFYRLEERKRYESTLYTSKSHRLRESDRGTFSSSSNDSPVPRSRNYYGARTRPFQESPNASSPSSRSYNSSESPVAYKGAFGSRPDRRGNRDYNQRDHQYDQLSPSTRLHLPSSARSWRQRRFCPSANSNANRNDSPADRYSRQPIGHSSGGPLRPDSALQACLDRGEPAAPVQSDYDRLLRLHAKVQEEMKEIEGLHSPHADPSADPQQSVLSEQGGSAGASLRAAPVGVKEQQQLLRPRMTIAEAVSDVSSDETESSSMERVGSGDGGSPLKVPVTAASPAEMPPVPAEPGCSGDKDHSVSSGIGDGSAVAATASSAAAVAAEEGVGASLQLAASPSTRSAEHQVQEEEEDVDQLELLELRRLALESAAQRMSKYTNDTDEIIPASSQSSPTIASSVKESSSEASQHASRAPEQKLENASHPKSSVIQVGAEKLDLSNGSVPKSLIQPSSAQDQHSLGHRAKAGSASRDRTCRKESSKDRDSDSKASKSKGSRAKARRGETKEKENSNRRARNEKGKAVLQRRPRPLPFAPVRLEKIALLKAISPRAGGLMDAARRAQRRARQTSVACQLLHPSSSSTSLSSSSHSRRRPYVSSDLHRSSEDIDTERRNEDRHQEIAKILSLKDPKEQVDRFLKLIQHCGMGESSSSWKTAPKLPSLTDNYEEVEMDIDSDDNIEALQNDIQTAMQPMPVNRMGSELIDLRAADFASAYDYMLGHGQWVTPYISASELYPRVVPYIVPPPPPPQPPLPPPPPAEEAVPPPLPPEDLPPPPPPPDRLFGVQAGTDAAEEGVCIKRPQISDIAQFVHDARTRQEASSEKDDVSAVSASPAVSEHSAASQVFSLEQKPSSEGLSSEKAVLAYSPSQSLSSSTPQKAVGPEEDEDEAELRAQLLRALAVRRREQAEGKANSTSSRESSPSASSAASPQHIMIPKSRVAPARRVPAPKAAPYAMRAMEFPVHKPVVVQLGNSSSEDEGQDTDGAPVSGLDIDSFLKAQRKTVESKQTPSADKPSDTRVVEVQGQRDCVLQQEKLLQQQEKLLRLLQQKEQDLDTLRQSVQKDQAQLKELLNNLNKFMSEQKKAEVKVAQLREQLQLMEQVVAGNAKLVASGKEQVRQTKDKVLRKKDLYKVAEAEVLSLGRKLHGPGFVLGATTPRELDMKRKVEVADGGFSVTFQPSPGKRKKLHPSSLTEAWKENIPSSQSPLSARAHSNAEKMAHLQKKSQLIMEEILRLKREEKARLRLDTQKKAQLSVSISSTDGRRSVIKDHSSKRESRLPSLESIKLDPVDSEDVSTVRARRRSLLDMTQSPKPTLLMKDRQNLQDSGQGSVAAPAVGNKKNQSIEFQMPSGSQLSNLCKIQKEKVEKVLSHSVCVPREIFSNLCPQYCPIPALRVALAGSRQTNHEEELGTTSLAYHSPLVHFRSFRFSPYYRSKEGLTITSTSFSHKLNPNRVLCRYDMQGTCNDQHCTWQHSRDYKMSDREILMDLVSYCPHLAGIADDTPQSAYANIIGDYVDNLLSQHKGKVTTDDLCVLLTAKINNAAKHVHPHTMFYDRRPWQPGASELTSFSLSIMSQFQTPSDTIGASVQTAQEVDSVLDAEDVRYFVTDTAQGGDVQDMEGAVLATPNDTQLWLRLAYSRLSNPARSREECLGQALNVLSRGLESNKNSTELWVHYLTLFRRHPDSSEDFEDLCQTALLSAPCYDIWWLLLEASVGFHAKDAVCTKTLDFLCGTAEGLEQQEAGPPSRPDEVRSHQVLEMLLYKVMLNIQSGRFKTALNFIQMVLGIRESKNKERFCAKSLTHADNCVLWICLVHLVEFQTLPASLYDPSNQNPGQIRSKDNLHIPWHSKQDLATPLEPLVEYLGRAVTPDPHKPPGSSPSPQYILTVQNLAELLRSRKKYMEACQILTQVLNCVPDQEDVWLMVADIYAGCQDYHNAAKVLLDATSANVFSAKLHYHAAVFEMSLGNEALEKLEQFVLGHYDLSNEEAVKSDPNFLFSKLLGLEVPVHKKIPPLKEGARKNAADRNVYLWLCFCLLLELQGETAEVVNTYEIALSATTRAADLCQLWKCYVQFLYRQHQNSLPAASESTLQQLQEAMMRSITTAPTLVPVPFPRQHQRQEQQWRDLSHMTSLVDFYMELISPDVAVTALHTFYDLMPDNISLLIRCVERAVEEGQTRRARSLCASAIYDKVPNLHLWKLALALAQQEGTPKEVERLYVRAVTAMPLSVSLWKDFLLFEVSQENPVAVHTILAQCQTLGLNIQGYVATISSSSAS